MAKVPRYCSQCGIALVEGRCRNTACDEYSIPLRLFTERTPEEGIINLVKWPEGYMLYYHGCLVWKSFP